MRRLIIASLMIFLLAGCSQGNEELQQLKEEVESLKSEVRTLKHQLQDAKDEISNVSTYLWSTSRDSDFIQEGLTKDQVKEIMGAPDKITSLGQGGVYYYGKSRVQFDNVSGLVIGWDNVDGNLKLE